MRFRRTKDSNSKFRKNQDINQKYEEGEFFWGIGNEYEKQ